MTRRLATIPVLAGGLALAVLLSACGVAQAPGKRPVSGSGIAGRTMVDGGCPVIRRGSPCPDRPLAARLTVTRAGSTRIVANVISDSHGYFRVALPPGRYVLWPHNLTGAVMPTARPLIVTVAAGRFAAVKISFDSGIR